MDSTTSLVEISSSFRIMNDAFVFVVYGGNIKLAAVALLLLPKKLMAALCKCACAAFWNDYTFRIVCVFLNGLYTLLFDYGVHFMLVSEYLAQFRGCNISWVWNHSYSNRQLSSYFGTEYHAHLTQMSFDVKFQILSHSKVLNLRCKKVCQ